MHERLSLMLRSALYALRGGFLIRPFLIALFFGAAGAVLSSAEEYSPALNSWIPAVLFPAHQDPAGRADDPGGHRQLDHDRGVDRLRDPADDADARLDAVFAAHSRQLRSRQGTQWTLGVFLGTFSYCMAALPAVRSLPQPFVPALTVLIAMALALVCVGWLIFFINHISRSISVNHIVDRIAHETEMVIDEMMPHPRGDYERANTRRRRARGGSESSPARKSGYVRFVDVRFLVDCAKSFGVQIALERRVGQFVPAGRRSCGSSTRAG